MSVLEVKDLKVFFDTVLGKIEVVKGVDFVLDKGETLGIVGESGSGKSVSSLAVMGLIPKQNGYAKALGILLNGQDIAGLSEKEMCNIRGNKISMIFQEPMTSLNPVMTVYKQLREVYKIHMPEKKNECREELIQILKKLNIPDAESVLSKYPFELSGGLKQRIMIAMAVLCRPEVIIADEPTTALDVTTQAEIIDLLKQIQIESKNAVLLITHDLGVIAEMAHRVCVMYFGKIVEECDAETFFDGAVHPYSKDLLGAMPEHFDGRFRSIEGNVPGLYEETAGCAYFDRCAYRMECCKDRQPPLQSIGENHKVRCFLASRDRKEKQEDKDA